MKLGNYSIPHNRLETLLAAAKKIYAEFKDNETSGEHIAQVLGHVPRSGTFLTKMADLRAYGIIEGRTKKVKLTNLAIKALSEENAERYKARENLVRNIQLWSKFLDLYGSGTLPDNFVIDLAEITGVELLDAQNSAEFIRKAYIEDIKLIEPVVNLVLSSLIQGIGSSHNSPMINPFAFGLQGVFPQLGLSYISPMTNPYTLGLQGIFPTTNPASVVGYVSIPELGKKIEIKDEPSLEVAIKLLNKDVRELLQKKKRRQPIQKKLLQK